MSYEVANNGVVREPTNDGTSFEVRVWCEDGTLMGCAEIDESNNMITWYDVDPSSGYAWSPMPIEFLSDPEQYMREWAEDYADWCREYCTCGTGDCGVMYEHGISIQYCRDGWTVDEWS